MKKILVLLILLLAVSSAVACNEAEITPDPTPEATSKTTPEPTPLETPVYITDTTRCLSLYLSEEYLAENTEECLEILKEKGYLDYDLERKTLTKRQLSELRCQNITPPYIRENAPSYVFYTFSDKTVIKIDGELYQLDRNAADLPGNICLWDHDGNGTKELLVYGYFGSGVDGREIYVFDPVTKEKKALYGALYPLEIFNFDGENIYLNDIKLIYKDGKLCNAYTGEPIQN